MTPADRDAALAKYSAMFEETGDDEALIAKLGSPTASAVRELRGYVPSGPEPAAEPDADELDGPVDTEPEPLDEPDEPVDAEPEAERAVDDEPEVNVDVDTADEPLVEPDGPVDTEPVDAEPVDAEPDDTVGNAVPGVPPSVDNPVETVERPGPAVVENFPDIEELIEEGVITGDADALAAASVGNAVPGVPPSDDTPVAIVEPSVAPDETGEPSDDLPAASVGNAVLSVPPSGDLPVEPAAPEEPKLRTGRLILYILFGALVCLPATLLLVLLTAALLGAGAGAVAGGAFVISLSFLGLTIFADILLLVGAGLVLAALGLASLLFGLWFFIRCVIGFVNLILRTGARWCREQEAVI